MTYKLHGCEIVVSECQRVAAVFRDECEPVVFACTADDYMRRLEAGEPLPMSLANNAAKMGQESPIEHGIYSEGEE